MDGTERQRIFLFRKRLEGGLGAGCKIIEIFSFKKSVFGSLCSDNVIARDSENIAAEGERSCWSSFKRL